MVYVLPPVIKLKRIALDLLFPRWCINCGREGEYICRDCSKLLSVLKPPICPKCGRPQDNKQICRDCINKRTDIDGIRSPFIFEGVIRQAVHKLKYDNIRALAEPLAVFLYNYLINNPITAEVLVPVPLHQKRLRERGYNQSGLLTKELSKLSGLPVMGNCLVRYRHTPPQARSASINERRENVTDAFMCIDNSMQDKRVLLIDDVATSGTTLNTCAGKIKSAGAISVWGLTVALEL